MGSRVVGGRPEAAARRRHDDSVRCASGGAPLVGPAAPAAAERSAGAVR